MKQKSKQASKTKKSAVALPPATLTKEFEIEGELYIRYNGGGPMFVIDDTHLSEFVRRHFRPKETEDGYRIGNVKVLIVPIHE